MQALADLKTETPPPSSTQESVTPALSEVLAEIGPLPRAALFMGVAADGLPVLLNLQDPHPGPVLIIGEAGSGKTVFLQTIAHSVVQTHNENDLQYGVVTACPDEWEGMEATAHRAGIYALQQDNAQDFILSLAAWAHSNKDTQQSVLLLIDDLTSVASLDDSTLQGLRWLLLRGPARHVWPIVTVNAAQYDQITSWLQNFRTRIFGRIEDQVAGGALGADKTASLDQLEARTQFSLREKENWLRFWLPSC